MSNEEAIKILKEVREEVLAKETELSKQVFENLGIKAIDLSIKALEQTELNPSYNSVKTELKSSEDCISRTEALKHSHIEYDDDGEGHRVIYVEDIEDMPSVKLTRPHGEWIYVQYDGNKNIGNWHCSNCRQICIAMHSMDDAFDFCPNCGCRMKGERE